MKWARRFTYPHAREGLIHQYMDEARQEFGARTSENVRVMRNRSRKGRYDSRL